MKNHKDDTPKDNKGPLPDTIKEAYYALGGLERLFAGAPDFGQKHGLSSQLASLFRADDDLSEILEDLQMKHPTGAMLINHSGRVVVISEPMARLLDLDIDQDIAEGNLDMEALNSIRQSMRTLSSALDKPARIVALAPEGPVRLGAIEPFSGKMGCLLLVRLIGQVWHDGTNKRLMELFSLTATEVELIHLLYQDLKAREIAEQRERSLATIRTQIKNILRKTNCTSQSELISIVSALVAEEPATALENGMEKIQLADGKKIAYHSYGPPNGPPVLMVHISTDPVLGERTQKAFQHANLRMISPLREEVHYTGNLDKHIADYNKMAHELLKALGIGRYLVAGHGEGAIYAAHFAATYPNQATAVLSINMTPPAKELPDNLIPAAKSLFKVAHAYPVGTELATRVMRRFMNQSDAAMRYFIDLMASDHPADQRDLKDPVIREIFATNYRTSYADCALAAKLISLWYSDWSKIADQVAAKMPLCFIQGELNESVLPQSTISYCREHPGVSGRIVPEAGHCLLYTHTDEVIDEIKKLIPNT